METKKEQVVKAELGMKVYHEGIYGGKESMKVIGIREFSVELEGDYSGGTHAVSQSSWMTLEGTFRLMKVCEQHRGGKPCGLHNLHCGYPNCEPYL